MVLRSDEEAMRQLPSLRPGDEAVQNQADCLECQESAERTTPVVARSALQRAAAAAVLAKELLCNCDYSSDDCDRGSRLLHEALKLLSLGQNTAPASTEVQLAARVRRAHNVCCGVVESSDDDHGRQM
jgi:hypothetical protein